ncbi:MAG: M20/M25/M40 family metallo-hydrolase [Bacteroidales bacterium]|nr:M20/M25/M40 family metallo-hydrolase [Bacteroidales bacterium]
MIEGSEQWITTRNFQYNSVQNLAAAFIKQQFEAYGLEARYQDYSATGRNIIGWKTGVKYPDKKYIICAHYDNMPTALIAPGADDNASGVVAVMEAARILAPYTSEYTLEFAAWDEEEIGLVGSAAYADSAAMAGMQIMGVLNFDMISWDSNGDFRMTIGTNSGSQSLTNDYESVMGIYTPAINWNYTDITASDHASFWNQGYPAILGIEEYPDDFNAYYHTPQDLFDNLNIPYFQKMVQAAIAGLASLGWNCRMNLQHQQVASGVNTTDQIAVLKVQTPRQVASGGNLPRLYYQVNGGMFQYLNPYSVNGTNYSFLIPGQPYGTVVSYYMAVQDEDGIILETLPSGGRGINPPGTIAPASFYSYFVAPNQVQTICSSSTPKIIPDQSIIYDSIPLYFEGGVKDIDIEIDVSHTRVKTLNISLIGPDGTKIDLSSGNGGSGSNFTNTLFDDEATQSITVGTPPYTGRFRPEESLSSFDTKSVYGNWVLEIQDSVVSQVGTLNSWCITVDYYDLNAGVKEMEIPSNLVLGQNFPNPVVTGFTKIPIRTKGTQVIELALYDILGRKVKVLSSGEYEAGTHIVECDLNGISSGTYFYRISGGVESSAKALMIQN